MTTILSKLLNEKVLVNPKKPVQDFWVSLMSIIGHSSPLPPLPDPLIVHVLVANTTAAHSRPTLAVFTFEKPVALTLVVEHLHRDSSARTLVILPQALSLAGARKRQLSNRVDTFLADLGIDLSNTLLKPVCRVVSDS